ncbi:MAG: DUF4140 domain-containing protein, partial [Myxococcales bacterium]|nr:DUF4140 domain-containing protein [Myxococcales bacterium]
MDSRIVKVEVFEDRAAITRVVEVQAGRSTVRIGPVSDLVAADRLTTPREAGDADWTLEDLRIDTVHLTEQEADSAELGRLRAERDRLRDGMGV